MHEFLSSLHFQYFKFYILRTLWLASYYIGHVYVYLFYMLVCLFILYVSLFIYSLC